MNKANKIYVRLGVEDIVIPIEDIEEDTNPKLINTYFIGYEDENGNECEEDGTYLKEGKDE
jgi:hypothetical protein